MIDFRQLFREAVRLRLQADVPVGLYLSGGIDSSAIAVECAALNQKIAALTVTFDADSTDLPHACTVAKQFGLQHEIVHATGRQLADDLTNIHWFYDEPFADSSSIPCYYIARQTQGRFKVILTGDGGDEALAGYPHYEFVATKQLLKLGRGRRTKRWFLARRSVDLFSISRSVSTAATRNQLLHGCPARNGGFAGYFEKRTVPANRARRGTPSSIMVRSPCLSAQRFAVQNGHRTNGPQHRRPLAILGSPLAGMVPATAYQTISALSLEKTIIAPPTAATCPTKSSIAANTDSRPG